MVVEWALLFLVLYLLNNTMAKKLIHANKVTGIRRNIEKGGLDYETMGFQYDSLYYTGVWILRLGAQKDDGCRECQEKG